MLIWLRNAIYLSLLLAAAPWLVYRRIRTGRYRESWKPKLFGTSQSARFDIPCSGRVWLHGVSVGEVQLLLPLIQAWQQADPSKQFAVSTTTETGMELARKLLPDSVPLFYFPFDFSWAVRKTIASIQPSMLVLGELELWPNLIDIAEQNSIPIAVVNGRLSERSYRGYRRLNWITRSMFQKLNCVAAQNETYAERFVNCGTARARVQTTGSFKFDNVSFDPRAEQVCQLRELVGLQKHHRVWVVGSTQAPEESAALQAYLKAKIQFPELKLIVVPRHKERFDEVAQWMRAAEPRLVRRSEISHPIVAEEWDVLLVDTIGELRWWWGTAELALVGGSFGKRGGQNMLEPAAYGANVAFGPNTSNFRDIAEMLLTAEAALRIESLEQIEPWLIQQLQDPESGKHRGSRAQQLIARQQGALSRTIECLLAILPQAHSPTAPHPVCRL